MTPDRPRQERAERTRAQLIDTAAAAFAEHGYDGVSLNDLVSASGLSKGAFYFHFSSKEDLALATFRAKQEEMLSLLASEPAPANGADLVVSVLAKRAQLLREHPSFGCVMRLGAQFNLHHAPGSAYASYLDQAIGGWADLIAYGQRRGQFRADLDPHGAARAIFAALVGIDSLSHLSSGGKDLESRTDELTDLLLKGLLERAGGDQPALNTGEEDDHGQRSSRSTGRDTVRRPDSRPRKRGGRDL